MVQHIPNNPEDKNFIDSSLERTDLSSSIFENSDTSIDTDLGYEITHEFEKNGSVNKTVASTDLSIDIPLPQPSILVNEEVLPEIDVDRIKEIEEILLKDLDAFYQDLSETLRENFLQKGREASLKIQELLQKTTLNIKKIIRIIADWLKVIPGINKFFLEQEAKIRADRIIQSFRKEV